VIFFLLFLIAIFNFNYRKSYQVIMISLLIILLNGNNEMLIPITNLILLVILLERIIFQKKSKLNYLFLNVVSWLSSLAVIFAPGNINRKTYFDEGGYFLNSLKASVLSSGMFILKSLMEFPYFFLYLGLFLIIFYEIRKQRIQSYKYMHPLLLFGI